MVAIELGLVATLSLIILWAILHSGLSLRAEREQQLLSDRSIGCHRSIGGVGCSVVCYRTESIEQIERLLEVRYERYEVIAIVDSRSQPELFLTLVARYHMIEVNNPGRDISTSGRVSLFRSAKRCYRRVVVMDIDNNIDRYSALNQTLNIASYNYIIPIGPGVYLRLHAIESIAIKLSDNGHCEPQVLLSLGPEPCYIFRRDGVIARGGFSTNLPRKIAHLEWLYTHQSYICPPTPKSSQRLSTAWLLLLLCVVILAWWHTKQSDTPNDHILQRVSLLVAAILSCIVALRAIALWRSIALGTMKCSARSMLCYFRSFIAIFSRRKFIIT